MNLPLPVSGRRALVRDPGSHVAETVHALLQAGAVVDVAAAPGSSATLDDLAGRRLVRLVDPSTAGDDHDLVVRDRALAPGDEHATPHPPTTGAARGRVVLVGGGPGDPGLLTLAGMAALREADVVVADRLAPLGVLDQLDPRPEVIHVGKIPRGQFTPQEAINQVLVEHALAGRTVVRLKGGDGFVFGRGGEEWNACVDAGVPVEVVPGLSSSISGPALAGIPVTHRHLTQGFAVVSGHVPPGDPRSSVDWAALARTNLTIVVLMGVANLQAIADALIAAGLSPDTPAACVADAAMSSQRSVRAPLGGLAAAVAASDIAAPAITVIGATVDALSASPAAR